MISVGHVFRFGDGAGIDWKPLSQLVGRIADIVVASKGGKGRYQTDHCYKQGAAHGNLRPVMLHARFPHSRPAKAFVNKDLPGCPNICA
jgi:hypothetical protein